MKEKNTNTITDLSDADFLSFLYSERDRENSLRQYQGWNIWALMGAIATMVCAGYLVLKEHLCLINFIQVLYLISVAFSFVLCFRIIAFLLNKEKGVDYGKVKTIKDVSPDCYLWCSLLLSFALSVLIPVVDKENRWNVVSIGWIYLVVVFLIGIISTFVNKDKIVVSFIDEMVFPNVKWDRIYSQLVICPMAVVGVFSIRYISFPIATSEFELAVCITVTALLVYLLTKVLKSEKEANKIDVLIADYVYKNDSKEFIYRMMRIYKMGNTVMESCSKEIFEICTSLEKIEQTKKNFEDVAHQYEIDDVDVARTPQDVKIMDDALNLLVKLANNVSEIIDKLEQVMTRVPSLGNDSDYQKVFSMTRFAQEKTAELMDSVKASLSKIRSWVEMNRCEKYDCICWEGCEHRHDNIAIRTKIRNRITHTKTKPRKCYK